jgi:hypothetical protein
MRTPQASRWPPAGYLIGLFGRGVLFDSVIFLPTVVTG